MRFCGAGVQRQSVLKRVQRSRVIPFIAADDSEQVVSIHTRGVQAQVVGNCGVRLRKSSFLEQDLCLREARRLSVCRIRLLARLRALTATHELGASECCKKDDTQSCPGA